MLTTTDELAEDVIGEDAVFEVVVLLLLVDVGVVLVDVLVGVVLVDVDDGVVLVDELEGVVLVDVDVDVDVDVVEVDVVEPKRKIGGWVSVEVGHPCKWGKYEKMMKTAGRWRSYCYC